MNTQDPNNADAPRPGRDGADADFPDSLRWQLRALRRDEAPATDLWTGIAPRLSAPTRPAVPARPRWLAPTALAVSLALVAGIAGFWPRGDETASLDRGFTAEAEGMQRQYQAAIQELAPQPVSATVAPVLDELDRSAALILDAIRQAPASPQLLDQLRRTYDRRIALMRRAAT